MRVGSGHSLGNRRENEGEKFSVPSVSFTMRYKKGDGEWASTESFGRNDLPKLQIVAGKAYEYLCRPEAAQPQETKAAGS
jgi:hypothetical protein